MDLLSQEYNEKIAKIGVFLTARNERVSTAESCTGGLVSVALTQIPGASAWYSGSVTAYDNAVKSEVLEVTDDTLIKWGAVSRECVEEMLTGVQRLLKAHWAVAVSGIAGPSGQTPEKPVGTVFVGVAYKGNILEVSQNLFEGKRAQVCLQSVQKALDMLLTHIEKKMALW